MSRGNEAGKTTAHYPDTTTERLEIFSDGVIAIAITLLVLDIKVPHPMGSTNLFEAIGDEWPALLAFALSFAVIGLIWVSHHSMFEHIAHVDRGLLFTNLLLLLGIAFLPFPTALLAEFVAEGGSNAHQAAAIYSATMAGIGFAFSGIWLHLDRHPGLLLEGNARTNVHRSFQRSLVGPFVYTATIALAFVSAIACFVVYFLIAVYFAWGPSSRALREGQTVEAVIPEPHEEI